MAKQQLLASTHVSVHGFSALRLGPTEFISVGSDCRGGGVRCDLYLPWEDPSSMSGFQHSSPRWSSYSRSQQGVSQHPPGSTD